MKSKMKFSLVFIAGIIIYGVSFIATKRTNVNDDPCFIALESRINSDTSIGNHLYWNSGYRDTLLFGGDTTRPGNWDKITDTLCSIYKRNCGTVVPILITNYRDTARSSWDTRFGKKIFFKVCP